MTCNRLLRDFLRRYLKEMPVAIPVNPLRLTDHGSEFVLYRDAPFQVELIIVRPHWEISAHVHPNVDSYERFLQHGQGTAWEGHRLVTSDHLKARPGHAGSGFLPHGMPHGAQTGEGAAFLSIQHWLNGVSPTFITDDWEDAS